MTITKTTLLVATMALTQTVLSDCKWEKYHVGTWTKDNFWTDDFNCPTSRHILGHYCQREVTYKSFRGRCSFIPRCAPGDEEIDWEWCGFPYWPRYTKTCRSPELIDYGCGCGKSPRDCDCQCGRRRLEDEGVAVDSFFPGREPGSETGNEESNDFQECPTGFKLEKNTDYAGNDIGCGELYTTDEAAKHCKDNRSCRGFSVTSSGETPYLPWCFKKALANKRSTTTHHFCVKEQTVENSGIRLEALEGGDYVEDESLAEKRETRLDAPTADEGGD